MSALPINPPTWPKPKGYNNGLLYPSGRTLFIAGQIGWDTEGQLASGFAAQFELALSNVREVLDAAGGSPDQIGRMTIYVTDKHAYNRSKKAIGSSFKKHMQRHYPTMSLVQVADLLEPGALVEIEATAILPGEVK